MGGPVGWSSRHGRTALWLGGTGRGIRFWEREDCLGIVEGLRGYTAENSEKKQKNKIVAFVMTSEFIPPFRSGAKWPHWSTCYYSSNADGEKTARLCPYKGTETHFNTAINSNHPPPRQAPLETTADITYTTYMASEYFPHANG